MSFAFCLRQKKNDSLSHKANSCRKTSKSRHRSLTPVSYRRTSSQSTSINAKKLMMTSVDRPQRAKSLQNLSTMDWSPPQLKPMILNLPKSSGSPPTTMATLRQESFDTKIATTTLTTKDPRWNLGPSVKPSPLNSRSPLHKFNSNSLTPENANAPLTASLLGEPSRKMPSLKLHNPQVPIPNQSGNSLFRQSHPSRCNQLGKSPLLIYDLENPLATDNTLQEEELVKSIGIPSIFQELQPHSPAPLQLSQASYHQADQSLSSSQVPCHLDVIQPQVRTLDLSIPVLSVPRTLPFTLKNSKLEEFFSESDSSFLHSLSDSINQITYNSVSESTQNAYASTYRNIITAKIIPALKFDPYPFQNELVVKAIFTLLLGCPQVNETYVNKTDGKLRWSNVMTLKSAIMATCSLNNQWTVFSFPSPGFEKFWKGLRNSCSHSKKEKIVVPFGMVYSACVHAYRASLLNPITKEALHTIRTAAVMVIGFYGIRRNAEVIDLKRGNITSVTTHMSILIEKAKNDTIALGHTAVIPYVKHLGVGCPVKTVNLWVDESELYMEKNGFTYNRNSPLFFNITGKNVFGKMSVDSHRKDIAKSYQKHFQKLPGAVLSLRRGGASLFADLNHRNVSKTQGGWKSTSILDGTYAKISDPEMANIMKNVLVTAFDIWSMENSLQRIESSTVKGSHFKLLSPGVFLRLYNNRMCIPRRRFVDLAPTFISKLENIRYQHKSFTAFREWYKAFS